jgi:hypothetical protein
MASVYYVGNAATQAQVVTGTVTAVANGATLTATINGKAVTYTCTGSDTTTTATTAWLALLLASASPEFGEINWTSSTNILKATAGNPGTPFAGVTGNGLVFSAAGGAAVTTTNVTANISPSDVGNAANWLRSGVAALPVNGDDIILQNCSVPLSWNLDALAAIKPASVTRWQTQTGQIGLPFNNPLGYPEWRVTYFQFSGASAGTLTVNIGVGTGSGPSLERYQTFDTGENLTVTVLNASAVELLPASTTNVINVHNATVSIAMNAGETVTLHSGVNVDSGGTLNLGAGVTITGIMLTVNTGTLGLYANTSPSQILCTQAVVTVGSVGQTYTNFSAVTGSSVTWLSNSNITNLTIRSNTTFDKSQDWRAITISNSTIEADTCQIIDPLNTITFTNATNMVNPSNSGPFIYGAGKTCKIT